MATFPAPSFTLTRSLTIPTAVIGGNKFKPVLSFKPKFTLTFDWWWLDGTAWCAELQDTFGQVSMPAISGLDSALFCQDVYLAPNGVQVAFHMLGGTPGVIYQFTPLLTTNLLGATWSQEITFPIAGTDDYAPNIYQATNANVPLIAGGIPIPVGG